MIEQDIIIIGSGVAGMSAAQYASRAGRSVTVMEELAPVSITELTDGKFILDMGQIRLPAKRK